MSIINSNLVLSSNVGLAMYCLDGHLHGSNLVRVSPAKYLQTGDWKVSQGFSKLYLGIFLRMHGQLLSFKVKGSA